MFGTKMSCAGFYKQTYKLVGTLVTFTLCIITEITETVDAVTKTGLLLWLK